MPLDTTFCYRDYPHQHHFQINYSINIQGSISCQAVSLHLQQMLFASALYTQQWPMVGRAPDSKQNTEQTFFLESIFVLSLRSFSWTGDHARQSGAGEAEIVWVLSGLWGTGSSFWQGLPSSPFLHPWVLLPMMRAFPECQGWSTRDRKCGTLQRWSTSPAGCTFPPPFLKQKHCIPREHSPASGATLAFASVEATRNEAGSNASWWELGTGLPLFASPGELLQTCGCDQSKELWLCLAGPCTQDNRCRTDIRTSDDIFSPIFSMLTQAWAECLMLVHTASTA